MNETNFVGSQSEGFSAWSHCIHGPRAKFWGCSQCWLAIVRGEQPKDTLTQREYFPQQDAKWPHITLDSVNLVKNGFRCHPLKWESCLESQNGREPWNNIRNTNSPLGPGLGELCQGTMNLHLLSRHSQGLCRCLWPNQSHRSSQCCYQLEGCSEQPSPDECTEEKAQRRLRGPPGPSMVQAYRFSARRKSRYWVWRGKEWKFRTGKYLRSAQPQIKGLKLQFTDRLRSWPVLKFGWVGRISTTMEWFLPFGCHYYVLSFRHWDITSEYTSILSTAFYC